MWKVETTGLVAILFFCISFLVLDSVVLFFFFFLGCGLWYVLLLFFMCCFLYLLFMCRVSVVVDGRELGSRRVMAVKGFGLEGCSVSVENLLFGDYLFDDVVVWEYKTVSDFIGSLFNESLFNEVFNQSEVYPFSFLIIEGDFKSFLYNQYFRRGKSHKDGGENVKEYINRNMRMVNGAIRRCRTICNVLQFKTQGECLNEIYEQSMKCLNYKEYGGMVRPSLEYHRNPCKNVLMEINGVGDKVSDNIIEMFGLTCLNDLGRVSYDGLLEVKGVNENMAKEFMKKMYGEESSYETYR